MKEYVWAVEEILKSTDGKRRKNTSIGAKFLFYCSKKEQIMSKGRVIDSVKHLTHFEAEQ